MARGVLLGVLVTDLRAELVQAVTSSAGLNYRPTLIRKLQSVQNFLYHDFTWPFLKVAPPDTLLAYQSRYYDIPAALTLETITDVQVYWGGVWSKPLERGITLDNYSQYNPDKLVTVDPVMRWDVRYTGVKEQLEVWPMPNANGTPLRITGKQKLAPFAADGDACTLDSDLLIYWAAADILEKEGAKNAATMRGMANSIYNRLKGRVSKVPQVHSFADPSVEQSVSRVPIVAYVRNQ